MYCKNCGNKVSDDANFCEHCGYRVNVKEKDDYNSDEFFQDDYRKQEQKYSQKNSGESEIGYGVLGFFFPLIGLILGLCWKDNYPARSHYLIKGCIIGFVVSVCVGLVSGILAAILSTALLV